MLLLAQGRTNQEIAQGLVEIAILVPTDTSLTPTGRYGAKQRETSNRGIRLK